jgi:choline dehydrogenase-like flavoprotein
MNAASVAEIKDQAFDVCVVGSGMIGLGTATALARRHLSVLVIEAGGERPTIASADPIGATVMDEARHAPMQLAVARAFGGTGWLWGGRCIPLDQIDFEPRATIDSEGWPISAADLAPYNDEAAAILGCGPAIFRCSPVPELPESDCDLDLAGAERWCDEPNTARKLMRSGALTGITIVLDATVIDLEIAAAGSSVTALIVKSCGRTYRLSGARNIVVAGGGLETARLLLHVARQHSELFGGANGALGRYYMGHMSGKIARIKFASPAMAEAFDYGISDGFAVRRRMSFTRKALRERELPNIIFYPDNPALADPAHCSGLLSALWLVLVSPLGSRLLPEAIRLSQIGKRRDYAAHMRNVIRDLPNAVCELAGIAWQRFVEKRRKPHVFIRASNGEYPLHYHSEHKPSRVSRVWLGAECDENGMSRLVIDLRFTREDADAVVRAHEEFDAALRCARIGQLIYDVPLEERFATVLAQAKDGFHQMGLARMGRSNDSSVVDFNCRVHGLDNLYLAGSAVFRTGGQANPTFSAVALGIRLADHLAGKARVPGKAMVA